MQGKLGRRPLKKNLQDAKLAPWQREQVHLLLIEQQVMGVFTAQGFWPVANLPREAHGYLPTLLSEKA
jgi:tRNA(Ile)-lysidine synthase